MLMWGDNPDGRDELERLRERVVELEAVVDQMEAEITILRKEVADSNGCKQP
jgi:hypothetical protein